MPAPGRPIEIREAPAPVLEQGAVLLKTLASEVCGTDVHLWHGRLAGVPYPLIPGHVSVGEVLSTGGGGREIGGREIRPRQAVTFPDVHQTWNNSWDCPVGQEYTGGPHRKVYRVTTGAEVS